MFGFNKINSSFKNETEDCKKAGLGVLLFLSFFLFRLININKSQE